MKTQLESKSTTSKPRHCRYTAKCPRCGEPLRRTRAHAGDRLLNLIWSGHRFRCYNLPCQWEGRRRIRDLETCGEQAAPLTFAPSLSGQG